MVKPVLIMAGGTGGHIYPALAVADYLKGAGVDTCWLGSHRGLEKEIVPRHGYSLHTISVSAVRGRGIVRLLMAPFMLLFALAQAMRLISKIDPGVVLGMGGFASGPGGLAAWLCGRPLVIHEQNALPGLTNQLLARFAARVLGGFPCRLGNREAEHTGNPVRADFLEFAPRELRDEAANVLVFGGSGGARFLNETVPHALGQVGGCDVEIRHQCGSGSQQVKRAYERYNVKASVENYIEDMKAAYQWADLVIARAGAMTIAEIAAAGLPSILVPYPFAVDDHQAANARYLSEAGAAVFARQEDLDAGRFAELIKALLMNHKRRVTMGNKARELARLDATERVAQQCLDLINHAR
ncbi:MAG: undecaprenyldiphospho-muramoylpentapeptide beta-N-acetylglucosaminyltransferase [Pseudomonadota bacterium]